MTKYFITCYGDRVAEYETEQQAKEAAGEHIWKCPEGAMSWANPVRWHVTWHGWASYANGEWLNHRIEVEA